MQDERYIGYNILPHHSCISLDSLIDIMYTSNYSGSGFRVQGSGFRVQSSRFKVQD